MAGLLPRLLRRPLALQRAVAAVAAMVLAVGALGFLIWSVTTGSQARLGWLTSIASVLAVALSAWAMSAAMLTWALRAGKRTAFSNALQGASRARCKELDAHQLRVADTLDGSSRRSPMGSSLGCQTHGRRGGMTMLASRLC